MMKTPAPWGTFNLAQSVRSKNRAAAGPKAKVARMAQITGEGLTLTKILDGLVVELVVRQIPR